jgi:hypothetical protein
MTTGYVPSPSDRVREQVALYEATDGVEGGTLEAHWWEVAERFWPHFPEYRAKAGDRDIPVMLLEPVEQSDSPTDLDESNGKR